MRDHFRCQLDWPINKVQLSIKKTSNSALPAVAAGVRSNPDQVNRLPEIRKEAEGETKLIICLLVGRKSSREREWGHGWVHFHHHQREKWGVQTISGLGWCALAREFHLQREDFYTPLNGCLRDETRFWGWGRFKLAIAPPRTADCLFIHIFGFS